jgi:carbamate kinase
VAIASNEHVTIDSTTKTVILTKGNGEQVNLFNLRNKESYIFEKIPSGMSIVSASNDQIRFEITLLEERSEPKWI